MFRNCVLGILMLAVIPGALALDTTWMGPTGTFSVYSARNLESMEYAWSLYFANIDREWDAMYGSEYVSLDYTYYLFPIALGITDFLEVSVSPNYLDIRRSPYLDDSDGFGDVFVNLKARIYDSEDWAFGALLQGKIATADEEDGLGTGEEDYGLSLLLTRTFASSRLHVNLGYRMVGEPDDVDFDDQFLWGIGFESDISEKWQFIAEFTGETSYSDIEPNDPMDLTAGFRYHCSYGGTFGGGMRYSFNMEDYSCPVGGFVQVGFSPSNRIEPTPTPIPTPPPVPEVVCSAEDLTVIQGEFTRIRVDVTDPLGGDLTYDWTSSGCRLEPNGNEAIFYADECDPGTYTVNVQVQNAGGYTNQCGVVIKVEAFRPRTEIVKLDLPVVPFKQGTRVDNVAKAILDDIAVKIQEYPGVTVELVGHTDSSGSEEANMKIGLKRAENVKKYLVDRHSIEAARFDVKSMGETEPMVDNATMDGRIINRRVEVIMMVEMPVE
ncbi:OmpA family protein [bacterium]|nr:OmpA family protein [candidate division CSSED10-310 bacterium]